jgi:DNA (cytosine-5)-methyltransferase 1
LKYDKSNIHLENLSENQKIKLTANIMFSGIGAQERGFRNSNLFDMDVLTTSDISKEATLSYAAIHCGLTNELVENYTEYPTREDMAQHLTDINLGYEPEKDKKFDWFKLLKRKNKSLEKYWLAVKLSNNLGDISKIEDLPYADFWSISFCCQDISVAGKMKGLKPDSGTRSSLLWNNIKLLEKAKKNNKSPKYVMFENVKNLVSKSFINDFNDLIEVMSELGFNTYWNILNGKECGIPQNRERVFVICIRKDIDTRLFDFPIPFDNGLRLRDLLDDVVDEKYYISNEKVEKILNSTFIQEKLRIQNTDSTCSTLLARDYKDPKCVPVRIENVYGEQFGTGYAGNVLHNIRVRKLTPMECGRLMGFTDDDNHKCEDIGVANSHLYKNYGNSIITNCVELLAEHLYKAQYDNTYICFDEQISSEKFDLNEISVVGNYMPSNHDASRIVDENGIAPCVKENHGTVTGVLQRNFIQPPTD